MLLGAAPNVSPPPCWLAPGRWAGALLGHVASIQGGRRGGGQLPRDDVTSVTAVTLKISAAAEGLLPFSAQILLFPLTWSWPGW